MKLPFFSSIFNKKEKIKYFLTLLLRDEKIIAAIFKEVNGQASIVSKHEENLPNTLETLPFEELLDILDKAISGIEEYVWAIEVQKTIFGVKENWAEGEKIKKEHLLKLKKISDALGLIPIGFLIIHEAIINLLQQEEGVPVSGILVEISQKNAAISLFRAGRVIETKRTKIEEDIAKVTDRLLHHFINQEVLPSRIIILSDKNNHEALSQSFISHSWSKSLPFLHVPQITILSEDFDVKSIIFGAATQMGFEVLDQQKEIQKPENNQIDKTLEEEFGFVKNKDVNEIKINIGTQQEEKLEPIIAETKHTKLRKLLISLGYIFYSSFKILKNIIKKLYVFKKFGKNKIIFIPPIIIAIIAIFLSYIFLLKATVSLSVRPKIVEQNQDITFSTKAPTDFSKNIISAKTLETTQDGKITKSASGKKEVGEKAKGTITILSALGKEQTFTKGTVITSSNKLKFALDETVKIASSSGLSDVKTIKTNVVAEDIGKEYNLPSGTKFTIDDFGSSEVEAKNDAAFSGGSKKEVMVVSKKDVEKAIEEITKNLEEKAKKSMEEKIDQKNKLLPVIVNSEFSQKSLDKKVGEETETFTIAGNINYNGISYPDDELQKLSKELLKEKTIDDAFIQDDISYALENSKKKNNNEVSAAIHVKALLLPKLEKEKIANTLSGKSFDEAQKILLKIPQVSHVSIKLSPSLPFVLKNLPRIAKNITVIVDKE
ncbi:MAG: baseplate J/gp47 family protein [Candidatus Levyibacteriota bacterium]|nr:MAG: baseplate J/gp47 family protein [Candidatus Levybacteria bacterium]